MAKISFGGIVSDARNKLGDVVYSRNRGGAFARGWGIPHNPKTFIQQANRTVLADVIHRWNNVLTMAQREVWNQYANVQTKTSTRFGKGRRSGHNWYAAINLPNQRYFAAWLDTPPPILSVFEPGPIVAATIDTATMHFDVTVTNVPAAGQAMIYYATRKLGNGVTRLYTGLTYIGGAGAGAPNPNNIWAGLIGTLFTPVPGDHVGLMIKGLDVTSLQFGYPWYKIIIAT